MRVGRWRSALWRPAWRILWSALATLGLAALSIVLLELTALAVAGESTHLTPIILLASTAGHAAWLLIIAALCLVPTAALRVTNRTWPASLAAAALAVLPAVSLAGALTAGDWVRQQGFAGALRLGLVAGLVMAAALLPPLVRRLWHSLAARLAAGASAAGLSIVNANTLPGLYVEAHLFLYALASLLLLFAWGPALATRQSLPVGSAMRGARALAVALGASVVLALPWLPTLGARTKTGMIAASPGLASAWTVLLPRPRGERLAEELQRLQAPAPKLPPPQTSPSIGDPPRNVLWIVVDTLRADALPPNRGQNQAFARPGDTPALDRWLARSFTFVNAYAQSTRTKESVPPMFRSLEPFEDPQKNGVSLATFSRNAGLIPVAVVPQYFVSPTESESQALLDGFEHVEVYAKDRQGTIIAQTRQVLERLKGEPFLAWVHFYNMHDPYFAGNQAKQEEASLPERYRHSLKWLDARFGELIGALEEFELAEKTLVVFSSDHGEHLGEGSRTGHGDGVHEPELHVPLAFRLPGTDSGGIVHALSGNIDVLPTIADVLGHPPHPSHRGRSLVPAMAQSRARSTRNYYATSGDEQTHAIVTQDHKLVYSIPHDTFSLHRRVEDPNDNRNIFGLNPQLDSQLVSALVRRNPGLFARELNSGALDAQIISALEAFSGKEPTPALEFLLKLTAHRSSPQVRRAATALFEPAQSTQLALLVTLHLAEETPAWNRRIDRLLSQASRKGNELDIVRALAAHRIVSTRSEVAPPRLEELLQNNARDALLAWLTLIESWPKPANQYTPPLLQILTKPTDARVHALALKSISNLVGLSPQDRLELEASILPFTNNSKRSVAVAAFEALHSIGSEQSAARAHEALVNASDSQLKQAALHTFARIRGPASIPQVIEAAKDPFLLMNAIHILRHFEDAKALPFLKRIARTHYNAWTRGEAEHAIARIESHGDQ